MDQATYDARYAELVKESARLERSLGFARTRAEKDQAEALVERWFERAVDALDKEFMESQDAIEFEIANSADVIAAEQYAEDAAVRHAERSD